MQIMFPKAALPMKVNYVYTLRKGEEKLYFEVLIMMLVIVILILVVR